MGQTEYDMAYYCASGRHRSYSFLAQRFDAREGFRAGRGESWIAWVEPDPKTELRCTFKWMSDAWYTGLWRSLADRVWVTESQGTVFEFARPDASFKKHDLPAMLMGAHGLADDDVVVWGERASRPAMFQWNGSAWSDMPAPPFEIECVHGTSRAALWASGAGGGVARWTGGAWETLATDTRERIVSIFVASHDELYACSDRGTIFEGAPGRWQKVGAIPETEAGDVQSVALWKGDLWIACSRLGLWKRVGKTAAFDRYKPKVDAVSIDVRDGIVVACKHKVASSDDGVGFCATAMEHLLTARANVPLCTP
jgi:hypothetical protein